jgi:aminopeptidase N
MWFGDLVTMRWWDDLWLNESFATYLSYLCLAEATRFSEAWQVFNGQMRPAAYRQDQLVTTHPVAADVPDTEAATSNFDAITYEKGAAVLKQLVATLGMDAFRNGLRSYFDRHAWGNAALADFLAALGAAARRPLEDWAHAWLETPAINTIGVRWSEAEGLVDAMEVWQSAPPDHPVLRPHSLRVGLVRAAPDGSSLTVRELPVTLDGASRQVSGVRGTAAPLFVFPDHGDQTYALARLDPRSLSFALERLTDLPGSLLRQQVWSTLWQMVRDTELPATDYLAAVRRFGPQEGDVALLQAILDRTATCLSICLPPGLAEAEASRAVAMALAAAEDSDDVDLRLTWVRSAISFAAAPADLRSLLELADGDRRIEGLVLDQDMRWAVAVKAAAHAVTDADARLDEEAARDRSDRGVRARIKAEVSRPTPEVKSRAWERIHGPGYGSDYLTRSAIAGFQWPHQQTLLRPYRERFFERVRGVHATHDHAFARAYVRGLLPDRWAEPVVVDRIEELVGPPLRSGERAPTPAPRGQGRSGPGDQDPLGRGRRGGRRGGRVTAPSVAGRPPRPVSAGDRRRCAAPAWASSSKPRT